jgi:hypothetical protein
LELLHLQYRAILQQVLSTLLLLVAVQANQTALVAAAVVVLSIYQLI